MRLELDLEKIGVNLLGVRTEHELIEMLRESDIYCQVSHIENSPNSLCEAMMLGIPVVATNVGGTSSLLTDGQEGILVQEGEPYSFAGAILELSNNFNAASEFAQKGRIRALKRHEPSKVVREITNAYNTILT